MHAESAQTYMKGNTHTHKIKIYFLKTYYFLLCVGMCTGMQAPVEARGVSLPRTGVMNYCEPPDIGAGNRTGSTEEQQVLSTMESSL